MNKLFILILSFSLVLLTSCKDQTSNPIDFGYEEGFFIYDSELNKVPWVRDRSYLSLKFNNNVSDDDINKILDEYNLTTKNQISSMKHFYVRCILNPAEYYYSNTNYENLSDLGESNLVEYSLPVFINEVGGTNLLTSTIRIKFEGIEEHEEISIIDSLITADNLILEKDSVSSGQTYHLSTSKGSIENTLQLSNRYSLLQNVRFASPEYAFKIDRIND